MEKYTAEQYRALDAEAFEARRAEVEAACLDENCALSVEELRSEAALIKAEADRRKLAGEVRSAKIDAVLGMSGMVKESSPQKRAVEEVEDFTDTMQYRKAFQEYVATGKKIELRQDQNTLTTDITTNNGSLIPTMLVNRIVQKLESYGMILPLVARTSFPGGIEVPTSSVRPVATWVAEGASSDRQKKTADVIVFTNHKLRCEISMSQEVKTMAISAFEAKFVEEVASAMTIAIEKAILAGTGTGQPTGILNGTIPAAQTVQWAAVTPTYAELIAAEAAIPVQYEASAKWFMTKAQFYKILGMVDSNKQPVARVDHGTEGRLQHTIFGRDVIIHPYATEMGSHLAGIFDFNDYLLNTIYDLGIQRTQDWDTEDWLTKAVMNVDGKPLTLDSLVVVDKSA